MMIKSLLFAFTFIATVSVGFAAEKQIVTAKLIDSDNFASELKNSKFVVSELVVKDRQTGLAWTRNGNINVAKWADAKKYEQNLNNIHFAGYSDWRLPTKNELETLTANAKAVTEVDFTRPNIYLNMVGFNNVSAKAYWTSNFNDTTERATFVSFYSGRVGNAKVEKARFHTLFVRNEQKP